MMNRKILIAAIIVFSAGIAFYSMRGMLTPYVSFASAKESQDFVQIFGKPDHSKEVVYTEEDFIFRMDDDRGDSIQVRYKGLKPANFEHADNVVVLGNYNKAEAIFEAEKILVKCPSKYTKQ